MGELSCHMFEVQWGWTCSVGELFCATGAMQAARVIDMLATCCGCGVQGGWYSGIGELFVINSSESVGPDYILACFVAKDTNIPWLTLIIPCSDLRFHKSSQVN